MDSAINEYKFNMTGKTLDCPKCNSIMYFDCTGQPAFRCTHCGSIIWLASDSETGDCE